MYFHVLQIDYVDGRARTERISDSSASKSITPINNPGMANSASSEVTIQQSAGTFVDSESSVDDTPPPPPPRTHVLHQHMKYIHNHHHHYPHGQGPYGQQQQQQNHVYHKNNGPAHAHVYAKNHGAFKSSVRSSHSSDSSSAYSGSDTMLQSAPSSVNEVENEVDLSGLMESVVDSDEEEFEEEFHDLTETSLIVRDAVRECLEKDPSDRTEDDVDVLLEFTQHLKAFTNMTLSVRRALVATMVFAVVEKAGTVVMTEGEELDSWSVIINGHVEILEKDNVVSRELGLGDSFGITPTMDKLYHRGVMRTKCDDCQFVCVTQTDYYRILHQGVENQKIHEGENGDVILVTENRQTEVGDHKARGHVVIRGTAKRLMAQLMEDNSNVVDPTYVEDFLLTYRTFLDSPVEIMKQLLEWFKDVHLRDKVTRVLLLWVNNHFTDFETDPSMMEHLEKFEASLEAEKMLGQQRMLNFACAAKARRRTVTLTRPSRDEPLQFSILGGYERGFGIFVSNVEKGSKADDIGLKRGDQILEVNGQSFEHVTKLTRALEILKGVCHLSITVKSNLLAFNEMLQSPPQAEGANGGSSELKPSQTRQRGKSVGAGSSSKGAADLQSAYSGSESALSSILNTVDGKSQQLSSSTTPKAGKSHNHGLKSGNHSHKSSSKLNKAFNRFLHKPKSLVSVDSVDSCEPISSNGSGLFQQQNNPAASAIASNPELQTHGPFEDAKSEFPEHVLKVYKADQTFKYLLVHKETTAHEVVMLSLQEFGITESSSNYTLCEVSVAEGGFVKQRRLPDALQNLAERIGLASRYYIKNVQSSEALLPDENVGDLMKDASVNLLQLNPVEVSTQLMVEDFTIFRQIEATEYVEDLFEIKSRYGTPSLSLFSELVNREMMWTISEIVSEPNANKRMRIIKQYIKVARQCKETQNFNSMFAIVSGLGHGAVSRLKSSWEKLPSKYQRVFNEMQQLMDPSRNMSKYRNLVNAEDVQPPIIPFYPVVKKDLTFIHLANDTKVDGLVNFEKLRMIAKEVGTQQTSNFGM
jgi:Rap guanine nucleotide exchange factor 2